MSMQAKRLRRIGDSRATVRADLNARDAAESARRRYSGATIRFGAGR